ncbi:MAG: GNAT family N-acetyltransferase [Calditrichaeota bacterium]|nr:MAG: GNAT family N-acetyltransferase [Calditrichota bacterium]
MSHQVRARLADLKRFGSGSRPFFHFFLAEHSGQAVGFALYFFTFSTFEGQPTLFLEDLFVLEHWRGQGIGRTLMSRLAEEALGAGCARMEWMVLNWNHPAQAFFQSLGAKPVPEWTLFRLEQQEIARLTRKPLNSEKS